MIFFFSFIELMMKFVPIFSCISLNSAFFRLSGKYNIKLINFFLPSKWGSIKPLFFIYESSIWDLNTFFKPNIDSSNLNNIFKLKFLAFQI